MSQTPPESAHDADSPVSTATHTETENNVDNRDDSQQPAESDAGNVTATAVLDDPADADNLAREAERLKNGVFGRLMKDGRWFRLGLATLRDEMMRECRKKKGMNRHESQVWVYSEIDRLYPPLEAKDEKPEKNAESPPTDTTTVSNCVGDSKTTTGGVTAGISGLGDLPDSWPSLPGSAPIQKELRWVQSERLLVVEERPNGAVVRLDQASVPAPSRSALSWLETSIRSYAKFVDVCARQLSDDDGDNEGVRREKMQIEEIEELLREMHEDEG